ncbi:MAG: VanW family protein [Defluviitaleaceae bacterium]|nr:VanW family protein [Defluviitaleaceae bacterium]
MGKMDVKPTAKRKLFCEISPLTYAISLRKMRLIRHIKNIFSPTKFAKTKAAPLPIILYKHTSLIRRRLGDVDMQLQDNKAANLSIAAPKINGVLVKPGETFSFWQLVGPCTKGKGYKEGLTISSGKPARGIGGGMCQYTNLIHWLVLHSPLEIIEHHHHDGVDLFPDYGRKVPFGCGTSIVYNYLDYRFKNNSDSTFQVLTHLTQTHLCGELRVNLAQENSYHIIEEDAHFEQIGEHYFRKNTIVKQTIDKRTGRELEREIIKKSHAKVMYPYPVTSPSPSQK